MIRGAGDPFRLRTPMEAELTHLLLQVADLAAAEAFYVGLLGFTVRSRSALNDGRPLLVTEQGLGLTIFPSAEPPAYTAVDHIAFLVPVIESIVGRLAEHGLAYEGPVTTERYGTSIYVRDPDGNRIELHDRSPGRQADDTSR